MGNGSKLSERLELSSETALIGIADKGCGCGIWGRLAIASSPAVLVGRELVASWRNRCALGQVNKEQALLFPMFFQRPPVAPTAWLWVFFAIHECGKCADPLVLTCCYAQPADCIHGVLCARNILCLLPLEQRRSPGLFGVLP